MTISLWDDGLTRAGAAKQNTEELDMQYYKKVSLCILLYFSDLNEGFCGFQ